MAQRPGAQGHIRKKVWKPKVKTGCITCRIRRVKCDEAKPHCDRCTSTGRKCDGYTPPANSPGNRQIASSPRRSPLGTFSSALHLESLEEQEAFHFFRYRASIELSGFFDSGFWQYEIFQACKTLPPVRHAILALSAMHRKFIEGRLPVVPDDSSDKHLRFALQQANLAIQDLIQPHSQQEPRRLSIADKMSMMTCAVLFNCLACIQGHQAVAIDHLRSGLKILKEVDEELIHSSYDPSSHPVSLSTLRGMFVNMDIQARGIMNDEQLVNWESQPKREGATHRTSFHTFAQARLYFEATFNDVLAFIQEIDVTPPRSPESMQRVIQEYKRLRNQFDAGSILLDKFLDDPAIKPDSQDKEPVIAIRLIQIQVKIVLQAFNRFDNKTRVIDVMWDMEEQDLKVMLDLASKLINARPDITLAPDAEPNHYYPSPSDNACQFNVPLRAKPTFSAGSGLLTAMWLVTSRTRDPILRRRAIAMLLDYPRREGVWDSLLAGRIAWEAMILEESSEDVNSGLSGMKLGEPLKSGYISDENKIRDISISYTGLRIARVEYRSTPQYIKGEKGVVRTICW